MAKNTPISFFPLEYPRTRIMATIGEANHSQAQIEEMMEAGASSFRFNAAHIEGGKFTFEPKPRVSGIIRDIRYLAELHQQPVATFLDLAGPKIRVARLLSCHQRYRQDCLPAERRRQPEGIRALPCCPEVNDTVLLYRDAYLKRASSSLGGIDPNAAANVPYGTYLKKQEVPSGEREQVKRFCVDEYWRLSIDISNFQTIEPHSLITLRDGKGSLRVTAVHRSFIEARLEDCASDFVFVPEQGVNPKGYVFPEILTRKDWKDFEWALKNDVDFVSVSFACSPEEYFRLRKKMWEVGKPENEMPPIFAKLEAVFAVEPEEAARYAEEKGLADRDRCEEYVDPKDHDRYRRLLARYVVDPIDAMCETFDGLMVARGDLAVEANKYLVPFYQKEIIRGSRVRNKPVIVATEVLSSMGDGNPSTRAEIGDIATAVLDGADSIMLGGEVASNEDAVTVVRELSLAIATAEEQERQLLEKDEGSEFHDRQRRLHVNAESYISRTRGFHLISPEAADRARWKVGMGGRACTAARAVNSSAIFASVSTGDTARYVSYFRPPQRIIAITSSHDAARKLLLESGVYPVVMQRELKRDLEGFILMAHEIHATLNIQPWAGAATGDFVVPGVLRIGSRLHADRNDPLLPDTVHEFHLPRRTEGVPEREKKYVLERDHYEALREYLRTEKSLAVSEVLQTNHYFYDDAGAIADTKSMLRIRVEEPVYLEGARPRAVLTIKRVGEAVGGGALERPEWEFDVTRTFVSRRGRVKSVDFSELSEMFRRIVWRKFEKEFQARGATSSDEVEIHRKARMRNTRITANVRCELVLELDAFRTVGRNQSYYELEIETLEAEEQRRDEYVDLLFGRLRIPVVWHDDYPAKMVRTLVDHGVIDMPARCEVAIAAVRERMGAAS